MYLRKRDAIDRNLLAMLVEDARISTSQLARKLGVARSTVNERISRLEKEGVIIGYCAIVKPELEVEETRAHFSLRCERARCAHIVSALETLPEIQECMSITGTYDLVCTVVTPSAEDLDAVVDEVSRINGIQSVDVTIVLASKFKRKALMSDTNVTRFPIAC
ncbi:Lrp/AsnC family transcriptional regulator [Stappia sp. BW2]|jgi:DNA-binding Lrp family transcriptional regulator|uniref:Lrp/AsnC family transcriptional regulator n=1 Tax=Stappia sp. BW2 TaxID=2592622 RepID=UPI0011DEC3E0|nr:Lrp/AsnC family transcriptional regulator [Stappia sp. BW2]TYC66348.1 Lrp/AsnC family transcriptional regulator [Stappia sp. BW2]